MQDLFGNNVEVIRTLGLFQPYASLMLLNNKLETRWVMKGKKPPFPLGMYLIYSTQKVYDILEVQAVSGAFMPPDVWLTDPRYHIRGHALFLARLQRVRDMKPQDQEWAFVERRLTSHESHRQVVLIFDTPKRINPFPFKGKQGVGFLSEEDKKKIEFV